MKHCFPKGKVRVFMARKARESFTKCSMHTVSMNMECTSLKWEYKACKSYSLSPNSFSQFQCVRHWYWHYLREQWMANLIDLRVREFKSEYSYAWNKHINIMTRGNMRHSKLGKFYNTRQTIYHFHSWHDLDHWAVLLNCNTMVKFYCPHQFINYSAITLGNICWHGATITFYVNIFRGDHWR